MLVPRQVLNGRHPAISQCARGAERKRRRLAEAELRESSERAFDAYGEPLENVTTFLYLGRVLTAGDGYWLAVVVNLGKARKIWGCLSRILSQEGEDTKVSGNFYKAVAQAVLLFGAETWVLAPRMERALDSFQHRVARRITGRQPMRQGGGIWEYPPLAEAMGEAGFEGSRKSGVLGGGYKAVAQAMLLFRAETWVLTPRMEWALDSFQHRVARRITGRQQRRRGGWDLGVPAIGGGNGGSGLRGDQKVGHKEAEHGHAVYCDATNS